MEPPDDGRTWIANTDGRHPPIDPNTLLWTWLSADRYGGDEEYQRDGLIARKWVWEPRPTGPHVTYWTSEPPTGLAPKGGTDIVAMLLGVQDG